MSELNKLLNEQVRGVKETPETVVETVEETTVDQTVEDAVEDKVEPVDEAPESEKDDDVNEHEEPTVESADEAIAEIEKKLEALKNENKALQEQADKWKKFSRQNESSLKELRREGEINTIMKAYNLPDEAKDFIKGENSDELKASAEKLSVILASKTQEESKKTFTSRLQGMDTGTAQTTSPFGQFFAGWGN